MEYIILSFIVVICLTIAFISKTYYWLTNETAYMSPIWKMPVPEPQIRSFNMETLQFSFIYSKEEIMRMYPMDPGNVMPRGKVEWEIKRAAEKIGREMLENGLIEVKERMHEYNPFMNEVSMIARVYKERTTL